MKKNFWFFFVEFDNKIIKIKDYWIIVDWILSIISLTFLSIFSMYWTYLFYKKYFIEDNLVLWEELLYLLFLSLLLLAWVCTFLYLLFSVGKKKPEYNSDIDMSQFDNKNSIISVVGVVKNTWWNTKAEYLVYISHLWHKKIYLRKNGFSYDKYALNYANIVSNYFWIPVVTKLDYINSYNKRILIFALFCILFTLFIIWIWYYK